eukprot:GHVR01109564.1.p1 GENE.GHVR01109564.1~~GHVR01109564.1.p1  ORF type:complete len:237 (+),score=43.41 GHVR01109564.1:691-1401(+)
MYMDPLDVAVIAVAALCHDVGHPGRSNKFLVNSRSALALIYNDASVLENYHTSLTFRTLYRGECNVFMGQSAEKFASVRGSIIETILDTDVANHFQSISKFRLRCGAKGFSFKENREDQWMVLRMCLKAADIGHSAVSWRQHLCWSVLVTEEFWNQGDDERARGLPISPLCDRYLDLDVAKNQIGFIDFICKDPFSILSSIDESGVIERVCVKQQLCNREKWLQVGVSIQSGGEQS